MANVNSPNGFTPAYHMSGGTIRPSEFEIASGTNASIFSGDVVNLSSGLVIQGTATGAPLGVFFLAPLSSTGQYPASELSSIVPNILIAGSPPAESV